MAADNAISWELLSELNSCVVTSRARLGHRRSSGGVLPPGLQPSYVGFPVLFVAVLHRRRQGRHVLRRVSVVQCAVWQRQQQRWK